MLRNGVNAWLGTSPSPKGGAGIVAWKLMAGALGSIAIWAMIHHAMTGKWPWDDRTAKFFQFPVGSGGPVSKFRHSKLGNMLWGKGPEIGYLNYGFFNPLIARGGRAMGIPGAFEARQLHGSVGQQMEAAQRDMLNAFLQPALGPAAKMSFVGISGQEPYVTGFRDRTGRVGLQFFPMVNPKVKPGLPFAAERAKAAAREINSFYGALGESTGFLGTDQGQKGSAWLHMIIDYALPTAGLVGSATNPYARSEMLQQQRNGTR